MSVQSTYTDFDGMKVSEHGRKTIILKFSQASLMFILHRLASLQKSPGGIW